jgi:2-C-methyl-D-erythritol 4-phosphate cytidylyltransferase
MVSDTLKEVEEGEILRTVPRSRLFRAETPQVFRRRILSQALRQSREEGIEGTDEASIVERLPAARVRAVEATGPNPKLTVPADLALIETLLSRSSVSDATSATGDLDC